VIFLAADCREIWLNYINWRAYLTKTNVDVAKFEAWLTEQATWMRSKIESHPSDEEAFWRHIAYIMAQFDGLHAGYVSVARPDWVQLYSYNYNNYVYLRCPYSMRCRVYVTVGCPSVCQPVQSIDIVQVAAAWARAANSDQ